MEDSETPVPDMKQVAQYSLGEDDMRKLVPGVKVVSYPDLQGQTVDSVLGKDGLAALLFLTENQQMGHWTSLIRHNPQLIEYLDSYGLQPDGDRVWLDKKEKVKLDEVLPHLHNLLQPFQRGGGRVIYSTSKLQRDVPNVNTCGRHVAARMLYRDTPLSTYQKWLGKEGSPDDKVCSITYNILGK